LAHLEAVWAAADVDEDQKALGVSLTRRVRRDTPGAGVLVRMAQDLALRVWWKAQEQGAALVTLNRSLSELNRSLRVLGIRPPAGRGGSSDGRGAGRRASIFSAPRVPEATDAEAPAPAGEAIDPTAPTNHEDPNEDDGNGVIAAASDDDDDGLAAD